MKKRLKSEAFVAAFQVYLSKKAVLAGAEDDLVETTELEDDFDPLQIRQGPDVRDRRRSDVVRDFGSSRIEREDFAEHISYILGHAE